VLVKRREYNDSVRLMQISEKLRGLAGVSEAILMMATENNKRLLESTGLLLDEAPLATANDLVIAIRADAADTADAAMQQAEGLLQNRAAADVAASFHTLDSALGALPAANLALISVPGQYAAAEARHALERGLHVMLFSDNVSLDDEVALKAQARQRGLLMLGPDCGTAILNGAALGFANIVRRGPIGIVGASGTGIQEITVLVHRLGCGISHAIGVGGRDLSAAVAGSSMLHGIDLLETDAGTRVIVVTSKPPAPAVAQAVLERLTRCRKPVVVNFLGAAPAAAHANLTWAATLEEAAAVAVRLVGLAGAAPSGPSLQALKAQAGEQAARMSADQKYLRGLFSGGTLGYEALLVLQNAIGDVRSNIPLRKDLRLADAWTSVEHTLIDLGDDEFTQARAHPMIDPTLRLRRFQEEAARSEVAVILLDIVLGLGSHADPAGSLATAIAGARAAAQAAGRNLVVVASVCGTDLDPQGLERQEQTLRAAGALVLPTNAQASQLAGLIVSQATARTGGAR
jgi:FdrA protein